MESYSRPFDWRQRKLGRSNSLLYYVLRGGANPAEDGAPGKNIDGMMYYLAAGERRDVIMHESMFNFIDTGECIIFEVNNKVRSVSGWLLK